MRDALFLLATFVASVVAMGWLALSVDVHWRQVYSNSPKGVSLTKRLRLRATLGLTISLALCLLVDHVSMASLVWVMNLTAAALGIAFTLTWRARWLRPLCRDENARSSHVPSTGNSS